MCDKPMTPEKGYKMPEFDFEQWWKSPFPHDMGRQLCHLKPLYDKMREWGFKGLILNWDFSGIGVLTRDYSPGRVLPEDFRFDGISDFPRAMHDAFKWMYNNRANKVKEKCDKDGPADYSFLFS